MEVIKRIYQKVFRYFDHLEDRVRGSFSKHPIVYAISSGIAIVLFWRGVWHTGDLLEARGGVLGFLFSGPVSVLLALIFLLLTGVFISVFVGDMLVLSGLKKEKKLVDKTEEEIKKETEEIQDVEQVVDDLYEEIDEVSDRQLVLEKKIDEQSEMLKKILEQEKNTKS